MQFLWNQRQNKISINNILLHLFLNTKRHRNEEVKKKIHKMSLQNLNTPYNKE